MGPLMRLEITLAGLELKPANHYTTRNVYVLGCMICLLLYITAICIVVIIIISYLSIYIYIYIRNNKGNNNYKRSTIIII